MPQQNNDIEFVSSELLKESHGHLIQSLLTLKQADAKIAELQLLLTAALMRETILLKALYNIKNSDMRYDGETPQMIAEKALGKAYPPKERKEANELAV